MRVLRSNLGRVKLSPRAETLHERLQQERHIMHRRVVSKPRCKMVSMNKAENCLLSLDIMRQTFLCLCLPKILDEHLSGT